MTTEGNYYIGCIDISGTLTRWVQSIEPLRWTSETIHALKFGTIREANRIINSNKHLSDALILQIKDIAQIESNVRSYYIYKIINGQTRWHRFDQWYLFLDDADIFTKRSDAVEVCNNLEEIARILPIKEKSKFYIVGIKDYKAIGYYVKSEKLWANYPGESTQFDSYDEAIKILKILEELYPEAKYEIKSLFSMKRDD